MPIERIPPGPGQESVWDYPRPPRLEPTAKRLQVRFGGVLVADTRAAFRVLETSSPPVYYFPPCDVRMEHLSPSRRRTFCEWKGQASYCTVQVGDHRAEDAAWTYRAPTPAFATIRDYIAFYPSRMDECRVDGEIATPQAGDFYGGWITRDIVGPFKGSPGTLHW